MAPKAYAVDWGITWAEDQMGSVGAWQMAEATGADVFRLQMRPSSVGNACTGSDGAYSGDPDFGILDLKVQRAADRGMKILPYVYEWCTIGTDTPVRGETSMDGYLDFLEALVARYSLHGTYWNTNTGADEPIDVWEIWNEPNLKGNGNGSAAAPHDFARLMIDANDRITQAQNSLRAGSRSEISVLLGGLMAKRGSEDGDLTEGDFLTQMLSPDQSPGDPKGYDAAEVRASFDGISYHPYALCQDGRTASEKVDEARTIFDSKRLSTKPIWVTELGWPVGETSYDCDEASGRQPINITEDEQASYLEDSFDRIEANSDSNDVELITWYSLHDSVGSLWDKNTGLKDSDLVNRKSWCSLVSFTGAPTCPRRASVGSILDIDWYLSGARAAVVYRNQNGEITNWTWTKDTGYIARNLGGDVSAGTSPAVTTDPVTGSIMVFFRDAYGRISMWHNLSGTGSWSYGTLGSDSAGDVGGGASPKVSVDHAKKMIDLAYRNTAGQVTLWTWTSSSGWVSRTLTGALEPGTDPDLIRDSIGNIVVVPSETNMKEPPLGR